MSGSFKKNHPVYINKIYTFYIACFGDSGGVYGVVVVVVVVITSAKNLSVHDRILFVKRLSILSDLHDGSANTLATAPQEFVRRRL